MHETLKNNNGSIKLLCFCGEIRIFSSYHLKTEKPIKMTAEKFWLGWLKVVAVTQAFIGIIMLIASQAPFLCKMREFMHASEILSVNTPCSEIKPLLGWLISSNGITMIQWSILMIYLVWFRVKNRDIKAVSVLLLGLSIWFVFDIGFSIYYSARYVIVMDVIIMLIYSAPLLSLQTLFRLKPNKINIPVESFSEEE